MICPYCETYNEGDGQYCGHCGLKMRPDPVETSRPNDSRIIWESQEQAYHGIFREDYPIYPPEALLDKPEYHYPQQESRRKRNLPILVLFIVCLFLIGIVLFLVFRSKQSNSTVAYEPNNDNNDTSVSAPETSQDNVFMLPSNQTDNQSNDADDANSTTFEIPVTHGKGLTHLHTITQQGTNKKFAGLGDGEYALIEESRVWVYDSSGQERRYIDLMDYGYCDLGAQFVRFDPYDQQFVVSCGLDYVIVYYGQAGDYVQSVSTGILQSLLFYREGLYHQHLYELYDGNEMVANALAGYSIGRLGLAFEAKYYISSDGQYIGTTWMDYPGILKVWRPKASSELYELYDVAGTAFSFDSCEIATINSNGNVNLWRCEDGSLIKEITFSNRAIQLQYGRGNKLGVIFENQSMIVLNPKSEQILAEFDIEDLNEIMLSPRLDFLVGIDENGLHQLYQINY